MPIYQVKRGDTIVEIARRHGFRQWEPIWKHEKNLELRIARRFPDVLAPGDKIFVPEKVPKKFQCEMDRRHTFRVRNLKQRIQQKIIDAEGNPLPGLTYELKAGSKVIKDQTDGQGILTAEIPLDIKSVELKLWIEDGDNSKECLTWTLELGQLEPVETVYGLKGRLTNLGYDCGPVNDQFDEQAKMALRAFQSDFDLPQTGERDGRTLRKLVEIHDDQLED